MMIAISFKKNEMDIYDYVKSKNDISSYIKNLIRREMQEERNIYTEEFMRILENKIEQIINKKGIVLNNRKEIESKKSESTYVFRKISAFTEDLEF